MYDLNSTVTVPVKTHTVKGEELMKQALMFAKE